MAGSSFARRMTSANIASMAMTPSGTNVICAKPRAISGTSQRPQGRSSPRARSRGQSRRREKRNRRRQHHHVVVEAIGRREDRREAKRRGLQREGLPAPPQPDQRGRERERDRALHRIGQRHRPPHIRARKKRSESCASRCRRPPAPRARDSEAKNALHLSAEGEGAANDERGTVAPAAKIRHRPDAISTSGISKPNCGL